MLSTLQQHTNPTSGAVITPALVAASLRYGGGRWTFDVVALASTIIAAVLPMLPDAPLPSSFDVADNQDAEDTPGEPQFQYQPDLMR